MCQEVSNCKDETTTTTTSTNRENLCKEYCMARGCVLLDTHNETKSNQEQPQLLHNNTLSYFKQFVHKILHLNMMSAYLSQNHLDFLNNFASSKDSNLDIATESSYILFNMLQVINFNTIDTSNSGIHHDTNELVMDIRVKLILLCTFIVSKIGTIWGWERVF